MGTELTPSSRSLSLDMEFEGRPVDNGLYTQSNPTTDGQKFYYGKRILTFDGKVFKYAHAKGGAVVAGFGAFNYFPVNKHITFAVLPVGISVGDKYCTVTYPSSCGYASTGFAQDELVGGSIVVGNSTTKVNNRTITANDAMGASTSTARIWVDGGFQTAQTVSTDGVEAYPNEFAYLAAGIGAGSVGSLDYNSVVGVPVINITSGYDGFVQTWGKCWVNPGGVDTDQGKHADNRLWYFVGDGSVNSGYGLSTTAPYHQLAGFCVDTTSSSVTAMPLINLQIST